jgi:hypothetical protein
LVALEAIHLRDHRLESKGKGREVRYEHELELDVSISAGAEEEMGNERLIGVVSEAALDLCPVDDLERRVVERGHHAARALIKGTVPDSATCPTLKFRLADGDWPGAVAQDRARRNAECELGAHLGEVSKLVVDPSRETCGA